MEKIDLGHDHSLWFFCWKPDRKLNPQFDDIPDIEKAGALIEHLTKDGIPCTGAVHFKSEAASKLFPADHLWTVQSWEPLSISPSVLCNRCGDHGFIREGKWVPA